MIYRGVFYYSWVYSLIAYGRVIACCFRKWRRGSLIISHKFPGLQRPSPCGRSRTEHFFGLSEALLLKTWTLCIQPELSTCIQEKVLNEFGYKMLCAYASQNRCQITYTRVKLRVLRCRGGVSPSRMRYILICICLTIWRAYHSWYSDYAKSWTTEKS